MENTPRTIPGTEEIFARYGYLETPRGRFQYGFKTLHDARKAGFNLHHQHQDEDGCTRYVVHCDSVAYGVLEAGLPGF